ncbi:MAG: YdeI/OmpD-associated family protein [Bacteroidota bacterium]
MDAQLISKLKLKPGYTRLVMNSPDGYLKKSDNADTTPAAKSRYDFVQVFIAGKAELNKFAPKAIKALKEDGLLWISYPKKTSTVKTDLSRDYGWDILEQAGFEGVALISIDATWSAMRFRPRENVTSKDQKTPVVKKQTFSAVLEKPDEKMDATFISIPFDVEKIFGSKGLVKVKARFDGYPYRGVLANMGTGCHVIIVRKDIRQAIGKKAGEKIKIEIELDLDERTVNVPEDLLDALANAPQAKKFFDGLSYTNRKEYATWITSAKRAETREKRLTETIRKLLKGLKNPTAKEG